MYAARERPFSFARAFSFSTRLFGRIMMMRGSGILKSISVIRAGNSMTY